jgi:hypothetical protein
MSDQMIDRSILPIRRPAFDGVTKKTLEGSAPDWNQAAKVTPPHAEVADGTLANAIRKSTAQIDKASAKELKAGPEEAGVGLAG